MSKSALDTYNLFKAKPGSQHIAKAHCLAGIIKYVRMRRAKNILELGIGIGTIPFALKLAKESGEIPHEFNYCGTEKTQSCVDAFRKNIPGYEDFINHFTEFAEIPRACLFDFIIVDGKDGNLRQILNLLAHRGTIIVEGGRNPQLKSIQETAKADGRKCLRSSEIVFSAGHFGGYSVHFFDPNFFDYLTHFRNRIVTFVKYRAIMLYLKNGFVHRYTGL